MLGLDKLQQALNEYKQAVDRLSGLAQEPPPPVRDGPVKREVQSFRGLARPA